MVLLCLLAPGGLLSLSQTPAFARPPKPTVSELKREVRRRDATIEDLLRRVEKLEQEMGKQAAAAQPKSTASNGRLPKQAARLAAGSGPASTAPPVGGDSSASSSDEPPTSQQGASTAPGERGKQALAAQPKSTASNGRLPKQAARVAAGSGPASTAPSVGGDSSASSSDESSTSQQGASSAPGVFKVDVQAAERALERTLTASGALLVPYGFVDFEPALSYARRETPNQVLFTNRRNEYTASATARIGLPWESQLTIGVPYAGVEAQTVNAFVSPVQQVSSRFGSSFGDLTMGVSKTLLHQGDWYPDLIGSISYEAPTGPFTTEGVSLPGSGQSKLGFSLTALKRQDPLAFVASVGYTKAFEHNNVNPGDQLSVLGGVYLASSPETTLSAVLQQNFVQAPSLNGVTIKGANAVQSILQFGASSILGRGLLLNIQAGVGLTPDSPKYSVVVSLPFRFGW